MQGKPYRNFDPDGSRTPDAPVRVAMFTDNYLPFIGGVPISIVRLSRGLQEKGSVVKIFAPSYGQDCPEEDNGMTCRCRAVFLGRKTRFPVTDIFSRKIREEFDSFHADLVHVHHPFWLGNHGRKLARKSGIPVVFTYHTHLDKFMHNVPLPGLALKQTYAHHLVRKFANSCDAIIAPGLSSEKYLRRLGVHGTIVAIPTGIDMRPYSLFRADGVSSFRHRFAPAGERLLICVCRLAREKNINFVIDGLKLVRERTSTPFKCIIVGDGPQREHLENRVAATGMDDTIFLIGAMEPDEVPKAYLASDLFVFASKTETQGMVLLEAMAGGCPVVAVNAGGVDDTIENGFNGYKVPEDPENWAASVRLLLENRALIETLSLNSRSYAGKFTEDRIAMRVLRLYRRALAPMPDTDLKGSRVRLKSGTRQASEGKYTQWAQM